MFVWFFQHQIHWFMLLVDVRCHIPLYSVSWLSASHLQINVTGFKLKTWWPVKSNRILKHSFLTRDLLHPFSYESYGVNCGLEHFFLTVHNVFCDENCVKSCVPQSSVLGPKLFLLSNNDIDRVCNSSSTIKLFADVLKIYSIFDISVSICNSSTNYLQDTINSVCLWAAKWQLSTNIHKYLW